MIKPLLSLLLCAVSFLPAAPQPFFDRFVCTDYSQGLILVFEHGEVVWQHEAPLSNDFWMLPNGNLLFTTGHGVLEMTRHNDTVFNYQSVNYIFACQRLNNGNTFVGECNSGRMLEISPKGKIVRETCILPEGKDDAGMGFIRNARRLDNGHYLVAHYGDRKVAEYDRKGRLVWERPVSGGAHSVMRTPDGHTYVAVADADKNPRIMEFDAHGDLIWELTNDDLPGAPLRFLGGMHLMDDGSIVFANWQGHGTYTGQPHILHVGHDKQLIDSFGTHPAIRTVSSVMMQLPGRIRLKDLAKRH